MNVYVYSFTGDVLELQIDGSEKVCDLKASIDESLGIPAITQRLLHEATFLEDQEILQDHCNDESSTLNVTMVMSDEEVYEYLFIKDQRKRALDAISRMPHRDNEKAIKALVKLSSSKDLDVEERELIVDAIAQVAQKGDKRATDSLLNLIRQGGDPAFLAIDAMAKIVNWGGSKAPDAMTSILKSDNKNMRKRALEAIRQTALESPTNAVEAIRECLYDRNGEVRAEAAEALGDIAPKGNVRSLETLSDMIKDRDRQVRRAAVFALGQVANVGSQRAMKEVCQCFEDREVSVRVAAVQAFGMLVPKKAPKDVVDVVQQALADREASVQAAARDVISKMAHEGSDRAASILAQMDDNDF